MRKCKGGHLPEHETTGLEHMETIKLLGKQVRRESPDVQALKFTARSRLRPSRKLEIAKGCYKVFDFAVRRGFAGLEVALNA